MQVLHVCSEMFPLLKTGGLADVIGALPAAQIADGVDTRVLLPAFPDVRRGVTDAQVVSRRDTFAGRISLLFGHFNGVGIYLIDAPHLLRSSREPVSRYQSFLLIPITFCVLPCLAGSAQRWPAGWTRSGGPISSMPTTGMQGWRPLIWRRRGDRRSLCSRYITWLIRGCITRNI